MADVAEVGAANAPFRLEDLPPMPTPDYSSIAHKPSLAT